MQSCFLVVKQSTWIAVVKNSKSKMTSFWSMWKMSCDVQVEMKLDNDQRVVAIIPGDPEILDDVRMGGVQTSVLAGVPLMRLWHGNARW